MKQLRKISIWAASGVFALASLPQLAQAATLTINGCATLTVEADGTITCNTAAPPPPVDGAPTGCKVSPSSVALEVTGGRVDAPTVVCTGGGQVAQTTWTRLQASASFPVTLPANALGSPQTYQYTGSVCTATKLCTTVSYSATVAANVTAPPSAGSCGNLKVITPLWNGQSTVGFNGQLYKTTGFAGNDTTILVSKIEVPAGVSGATTLAIYEYASAATNRKAWLSKTPCDTSNSVRPFYLNANGPVFSIQTGTVAPITKSVWMQAGETWYLMVKNESYSTTGSSCKTGSCEVGVTLLPPN